MSVKDGGESNEGGTVMCVGRGTCAGRVGLSERDCRRLLGVIQELREDLPHSFPFFFEFTKVVPLVGLERRR